LRDLSEKVLHKARNFRFRQFAEPNRIGEENRDDARTKRFFRGLRAASLFSLSSVPAMRRKLMQKGHSILGNRRAERLLRHS
jgi:hypothetical protein